MSDQHASSVAIWVMGVLCVIAAFIIIGCADEETLDNKWVRRGFSLAFALVFFSGWLEWFNLLPNAFSPVYQDTRLD